MKIEKENIRKLSHKIPSCDQEIQAMKFNHRNYDDYLIENVKCFNMDEQGSESWQNFFVKHMDYLANF